MGHTLSCHANWQNGGTITSDWSLVYRSLSSQTNLPQGPIKSAMMDFTAFRILLKNNATLLAGNDRSALNLISGLYGPRSLNPQFSSLVCQTWPLLTNKHSRGRGLAQVSHRYSYFNTSWYTRCKHCQDSTYASTFISTTQWRYNRHILVFLDLFDSMMKFGAHTQGHELTCIVEFGHIVVLLERKNHSCKPSTHSGHIVLARVLEYIWRCSSIDAVYQIRCRSVQRFWRRHFKVVNIIKNGQIHKHIILHDQFDFELWLGKHSKHYKSSSSYGNVPNGGTVGTQLNLGNEASWWAAPRWWE